jgi:3-hydroxymyristoyl/3-hydroxydecanoyl-(acyl carrier protein) dehydratase
VQLKLPRPGELLRHRGPALLIEQVTDFSGDTLLCQAVSHEEWGWPAILEAAAQCAGLLTGMQQDGQPSERVVAAYEDLVVSRLSHRGALQLRASQLRSVLGMQKSLLEVWVTLAAAP